MFQPVSTAHCPFITAVDSPLGSNYQYVRWFHHQYIRWFHCQLTPEDTTRIVLLYGNRTVKDILMRPLLDQWVKMYPDRLR
jgi:hypothetical protein